MSRVTSSIIRAIRLQLKSGYMKKEPQEFTFLKRYPPLHRDSKVAFHKVEARNIPYLDLLEKISNRNLAYDERVYPAYWQQEPIGLTLAKKQYQYMQAGNDEETAFRKAEEYVDQQENKAYMDSMDLHNAVKKAGAQAPFMKDEALATEIRTWQEKLKKTPYHMMESADQGEIDYMIQTKILKWNEVERERRMRDPVFVKQFRKLRRQLFPEDQQQVDARGKTRARKEKADYLQSKFAVDYSKVRAAAPFYLDDYVNFFNKVKAEPNIRKWTLEDRSAVSTWIINTLAIREVLENSSNEAIQTYLDTLKVQFFPMISKPSEARSFTSPTVDSLRKLLYDNDIGYKTEGGKVFVKRFYSIPKLLFPTDTFATALVEELNSMAPIDDEDEEDDLLSDKDGEDAAQPGQDRLQDYLHKFKIGMPDYDATRGDVTSPLDALIDDATRELSAPAASAKPATVTRERRSLAEEARSQIGDKLEVLLAERAAEKARLRAAKDAAYAALSQEEKMAAMDAEVESLLTEEGIYSRNKKPKVVPQEAMGGGDDSSSSSSSDSDGTQTSESESSDSSDDDGAVSASAKAVVTRAEKDEFAELMRKYRKPAVTELDRARDAYYDTEYMFDQATDEVDLETFRDDRTSFEFEERARLEALYKEKEEARLARQWSKRGLWQMPRPHVPVMGINDA